MTTSTQAGVPASNADEITVALNHAETIRTRLSGMQSDEAEVVRIQLDRVVRDIEKRGVESYGFFDTIPVYDRLNRIDRAAGKLLG